MSILCIHFAMNPRTSILDLFSTFAYLERDNFRRWAIDTRLRRSIQRCVAAQADRSEGLWSLYWFQLWQARSSPLAEPHLFAYLQEPCYWVSQQMARRVRTSEYTLADYFQLANIDIRKVLKSFVPDRGSTLKSYAALVLTNALKDTLRQRQAVDICSDWALLRKWSRKRVIEVLDRVGIAEQDAERYQLAWFCFKTLSVPTESGGERSATPDPAVWQEIADFYNTQRHSQLAVPGASLTPAQIEVRLTKLGRWLREYLYPTLNSLNRPKPGEEASEIQDDLSDDAGATLLDIAIEREEISQRTAERSQLQTILTQALAALTPELQEILQLFYQQGLSQQELASHLKLSQPTVSRRLKKAEENLLQALLTWIESQLNQFPDPTVLKSISTTLREWLIVHYAKNSENS
jgi:RNA polymerase sigma factor (sigma-70 family)